jgi:hypothetical protein
MYRQGKGLIRAKHGRFLTAFFAISFLLIRVTVALQVLTFQQDLKADEIGSPAYKRGD